MSMIEGSMHFARQQELTGTTDVVSTHVYDAGEAVKLFEGVGGREKLVVQVTEVGGTDPTFRARYVAADNAALTTNPIILADTGVSPALAAADIPKLYELRPALQTTAKRYYGVIFTMGGTTPTAKANAFVAETSQSRLVR